MAKKQSPAEKNKTPKNSKTQNKIKSGKTTSINTKINKKTKNEDKSRKKIRKTANDDASSEETEVAVVPSSSVESENDDVVESDEAKEENGVEQGSSTDEDEEEEKETLKSIKKKVEKNGVKNKGKKRSKNEEEDDGSEAEETGENSLYKFPMNRVSRIIKSENPDIRISQEAVFVINRAAEKFLQVFCREAYACAFLDDKKHTAYEHLSSVVSRRRRLNFLSDFIPPKVKAEDALAQISEAEKCDLD